MALRKTCWIGFLGLCALSGASLCHAGVDAQTKPKEDRKTGFTVGGMVLHVLKQEGDAVKKGDVLVELDDGEGLSLMALYKLKSDSDLEIRAAEEKQRIAELEAKKQDHLLEQHATSPFEVEKAHAEAKVAGLESDLARQQKAENAEQYQHAKVMHDRYVLTAKIDGRVEKLLVHEGELVEQEKPVLELVSTDLLLVDAAVPFSETLKLKTGDPAWVVSQLPGRDTQPIAGRITFMAEVADSQSDTRIVRVEIKNGNSAPAGEHVSVTFTEPKDKGLAAAAKQGDRSMTQASATGRGPRGWDRLVAQINASPDAVSFHRAMLDLQCKIVAAEYGAIWVLGPDGKPTPTEAWPQKLSQAPNEAPVMNLLTQAAKSGFERQSSHILKAEPEASTENSDLGAHVFVTVLRVKGQPAAVTTVVAECRDAQVLQSTAPLRELAAGLYEGFFAKLEAQRKEGEGQRVRQAMAILAVSQEAKGFGGASLNLVNELARHLNCVRVSLGWVRGRGVKLIAMSDTEHLRRKSEDAHLLELAMSECLDQEQPVVYPVPNGVEPLLQQAVVHTHKRLVGGSGRHVLSVPLRQRDEWIGVLVLERAETPFDPTVIQYVQLIADVVAPHLDDRHLADQMIYTHAWRDIETAAAYVIGPKHVAWKLLAIAVAAIIIACFVGKTQYKVTAQFHLEADGGRVVPAPYEGQIRTVLKRPGDEVKEGDVLATLDDTDIRYQLAQAQARYKTAALEYEKYKHGTEAKESEAQQSLATEQKEQAEIDLLKYHLDHSVLKSPVTGVVLANDLVDKIGTVVKQGEELFDVAPLGQLVAVIDVSDTDINEVTPQTTLGSLHTYSSTQDFAFHIERMVPAAKVEHTNKDNTFEVRARLDAPPHWFRPGMRGQAKIEIGPRTYWWAYTHAITDKVRYWLWYTFWFV